MNLSNLQPELPLGPPPPDADLLRSHLAGTGWQTRAQITRALGWTERQLRSAAESLGPDLVRGQAGFKLTSRLDREDLPLATQAADAFVSQGKRMIRHGLALRKRLHTLLS